MNEEIDFYGSLTKSINSSKTSDINKSRVKSKQNDLKICQVYSEFIQLQNTDDHSKIKKPKLIDQDKMEINENEEKKEINLSDTFIGINTFESDNVFSDLSNFGLLIICLEQKSDFAKSNFSFKGRCSINLISGCIQINGFKIDNTTEKWFDLFSPESNSYLTILNKQEDDANFGLTYHQIISKIQNLFHINIENSIEENLRNFLVKTNFNNKTSSLFAIRPLKSQLCNYICHFDNFQTVYQTNMNSSELTAENQSMYQIMNKFGIFPISEQHFNAIQLENENEKETVQEIVVDSELNTEGPIVMPCGGKDVGKSTFLRYLINSLLNKFQYVAYIDCDPGQCEFTLASCLSFSLISEPLLGEIQLIFKFISRITNKGPPHTHISHNGSNKKCFFLGYLSPNDVPGVYLYYLRKCYDEFVGLKSRLSLKIPLVINTMGWNQGLGLCLLKETILLFKPSHVIQINHPIEANKNMPVLDLEWLKNCDGWPASKRFDEKESEYDFIQKNISYKLKALKSNVPCKNSKFNKHPPQKRLSAKDQRNLAILAYFSKLNESDIYFKSIHSLRPYKISWSKLALHVSHSKVEYDQLFRVFNASLVCLASVDKKFINTKHDNHELPGYLNLFEDDVDIKCLGFGIVRAINIETKEFYILTPEPLDVLNEVNLLCKGMLNLPLEFFYEQDCTTPSPYLTLANDLHSSSSNQISNEPIQRKYLIHQSVNKKI